MIFKILNHYYLHKYFFSLFRRFSFNNQLYSYFIHRYNTTWKNERAIEVPIVWQLVRDEYGRGGKVLEIGNVLSHYYPVQHTIVDKYEQGDKVINQDIVLFSPHQQYDLIVSISTFEHIGWDESPRHKQKVRRAVKRVRSLLRPGGRAIITIPMGYNAPLDEQLIAGKLGFDSQAVLERISLDNRWREAGDSVLRSAQYGYPFGNANVVVIGEVRAN